MDKTSFLTIFPSFENLKVVQQTLPTVIAETRSNDARLIVHDCSQNSRKKKWAYLADLNRNHDFFLILSDNLSMAHSRNMCLTLGKELYAPDYICLLEDDHGYQPGIIPLLVETMKKYYGQVSPNGLRYGLFTGCARHNTQKRHVLADGNAYPDASNPPQEIGRANSCFHCAPTGHWDNVLKGYDTDGYLISTYQTKHLNARNYHKGFTCMIVQNGRFSFDVENQGRGFSGGQGLRLWDEEYAASDSRSRYLGKKSGRLPE
jgi:hypothetical protein